MDEPILEMQQVARTYRQGDETVHALRETDFTARAGELIAVIGPSGSGKSTFLTIAGGLRNPSRGTIKISGINITRLSLKQLSSVRLRHVGFILQASSLVPFLTVENQLRLIDKVARRPHDTEQAKQLFEALGIDKLRKKYPADLSGGERQRVAIAKILNSNPNLILADEPTASLDTAKAFDVVKLLAKETRERGKATIMVTHDERLVDFCDKVYEMQDGTLTLRKTARSKH